MPPRLQSDKVPRLRKAIAAAVVLMVGYCTLSRLDAEVITVGRAADGQSIVVKVTPLSKKPALLELLDSADA